MNKTVLKLCIGTWENENRDKRELSACRELGLEPLVMARGELTDWRKEDTANGFRVIRYSNRLFGEKLPRPCRLMISLLTWAWGARQLKPAIISAHDIEALTIAWLSTLGIPKARRPQLVYDSHEFELGRNAQRSKLKWFVLKYQERFLMKRCAFSIMVNDAIADEVQQIHNLKERPVVVRSTPNYWEIDPEENSCIREELLEKMEHPQQMMLMYHGNIMRGRGVEMLLRVVQSNPEVCLVVLGYGQEEYLAELKELAKVLNVLDRVLFHPAVSIDVLWKYVGAADVGMVTIPAVAKSYYYMLPNKFFENIQSETPVICSNYPAISPIVEKYGIGLTCDPTDPAKINECIERMRLDKEFYVACKQKLKKAKKDLCWEKEKKVLQDAYRKCFEKG